MSDPHTGPISAEQLNGLLGLRQQTYAQLHCAERRGVIESDIAANAAMLEALNALIAPLIQAARVDAAGEMRERMTDHFPYVNTISDRPFLTCGLVRGPYACGKELASVREWCDHIRTLPLPPAGESFLRKKIERAIQDTFAACMVDGQVPTYESILAEAAKEQT